MTDTRPLLILTAVLAEARAVAAAMGVACPKAGEPVRITRQPRPMELHIIGIGARHLPSGLSEAGAILLAGLAGGLDPALTVGDVILDGWTGPLPAGVAARTGRIVCSDRLVATAGQKAELFRQTGAAAVDMESDAVRRAAAGVPIAHLRAISDAAGDEIDPNLMRWVDTLGRPRPGMLALGLLKRPMLAAELARLARNVRTATRALAAATPAVIAAR